MDTKFYKVSEPVYIYIYTHTYEGKSISKLQIYIYTYEGKSISKLQIVIEKKQMGIMTYKQHLFFNIISKQI